MSHWNIQLDEEQRILYLWDTVILRKELVERQREIFGPLNVPPHMQIEIEFLEEELAQLDRRLRAARRRKRWEQAKQQVGRAARGLQRLMIPSHRAARRRKMGVMQQLLALVTRLIIVATLIGGVLVVVLWQTASSSAPVPSIRATSTSPQEDVHERRVVANTGGIGVRFRHAPEQDASWDVALEDGTTVYLIERLAGANDEVWWKVQLQDGAFGYIKEQYLGIP